ncbi:RNA polymerase subunit sigma-70 [Bacillus wiedmannii]|uniref:Sigma-70 family RNA polymerase sigma factor n=2 Tax=Bacillus cereus group TaxID=86661 RepID=A0A1C4GIT1_BACTU|nr:MULTISPECIES: sigma-70 family RNA polymerase sigma factor [Bacillus]AZJ23321.1 RNA polymerase subunit sigma-70 [Bacillus wiedmannii bv. thuringiensis]MCU5327679.1 sigma-70 family RNA polymerase sigma factor [Bacillus wiedmannii]MDP1456995.1 sigma-70 family RNA polymerase sigma factor [Bacillus wiedmannii]MED2011747.1 sigma-70 family RNA polymerase sigma factor [Bacillus wiedmannii]MED3021011.1 sigma-70 family RNA polymerase sigma factor [Bacillus wiedmannii]
MKPATFTETVVLYEGMIVNQIKKLGIYQDHEEYYQCGLIGLWHAYERFDAEKGSFPAYAVVTVRGYILERLKKESALQERNVYVGEYEEIFTFEDAEIRAKDFMSVLDEKEKYIIFERFFVGKTMGEIASEMEMTYYQVRWVYRQALEKMRNSLRG